MSAPAGDLGFFLNTTTAMIDSQHNRNLAYLAKFRYNIEYLYRKSVIDTKLWCSASNSHPSIVSQPSKFLGRLTWENTSVIYYVSLAF
jgi:hypothetical protein